VLRTRMKRQKTYIFLDNLQVHHTHLVRDNRDICWNCNLKCVNRVVLSKLLAKLHELGPIRASLRMIYDLDV
jgi:predicted transcriptional regulator